INSAMRFLLVRGLLLVSTSTLLPGCAQRSFQSQTLDPAAVATHHTVAILPFAVELERLGDMALGVHAGKWSDSTLDSGLRAKRQQMGYQLQAALQAALLRQQVHHAPTVTFQNPAETNQRLARAGIPYDSLATCSLAQVHAALGVDALLVGHTSLDQLLPGSLSLAVLVLSDHTNPLAENTVRTHLESYDTQSGQLVWQFDHELRGKLSVRPAALAKKLVRTMRGTFPYLKQ
ncbi:MAG: hypothetical protein ACRYF0_19985, partial [Janthinobacterium lividum]